MKKYLLAVLSGALVLTGVVSATQILETPPKTNTTKPIVRPSLNKVLDKRPGLPTTKSTTGSMMTGKVLPPVGTGKIAPLNTGNIMKGTGSVIKAVVQQNAADVKAFREENGYIIRYLKKATNSAEKKTIGEAVEKAIKTLISAQKSLRQTYENAAKTSTPMPEADWDKLADMAIDNYVSAVLPYIDTAKTAEFDKFIIGRRNLMKGLFEKLEVIRVVKTK